MFHSKAYSSRRDKIDREKLVECIDDGDDDHIYENVTKYKKLNGIINSLKVLRRKRDKHIHDDYCPPPMSDLSMFHSQLDDDISIFERNFEYQMDYENSYTSCEDDNIYENLEFFNDESFNNGSLNEWMLNLTHDIADYETDNIMFVKSIPSVLSVRRNTQNCQRRLNKNEITLNFLKILWNGENHVDIMSLLLQTFSSLLRDQNKQRHYINNNSDCSSLASNVLNDKEVSLKKELKKTRKRKTNNTRIIYQKAENVILSSSLNVLVITYSKSLKIFFILAYSEILFQLPTSVKVNQIICAIKNNFRLNFPSQLELTEFYKILNRLLRNRRREISGSEKSRKVGSDNAIEENSENIYQQIWTCQSISNSHDKTGIICSENIYSSLDYTAISDDSEWEVDHEFSFMNIVCDDKMMNQTYYKTIWVHYSDENPEYNKIFYDSSDIEASSALKEIKNKQADDSRLTVHVSSKRDYISEESVYYEANSVISDVNQEIPKNWHESIDDWKSLIRSPYYCEDEDEYDVLISEPILATTFPSLYNHIEDESSETATVHDSSFSLQLDEPKPSIGCYRSLSETAVVNESSSPSPKKERFRDRLFRKQKKYTVNEAFSEVSISSYKSEDDLDSSLIFGCYLENVEKDEYHKDIPKIVVECVNILELDVNIKTSGIYRISGNKNTIDAIKKKFNEKKQSKKESRQAFLQNQDVHTLTGVMKMFFRELKSPLMSKEIFTQCTSDKLTADQVGKILREMPPCNYATLKFLFKHFKMIEKYQNENLMNSGNLAICLGLCVFSNSFGEIPNPFDSDISKCNTLCKYLIDNFNQVFDKDGR